jgi:hypothetical protein
MRTQIAPIAGIMWLVTACGAGARPAEDGAGEAGTTGIEEPIAPAPVPGETESEDAQPRTREVGTRDAGEGATGQAGASGSAPDCGAVDVPDDGFEDSNCDGIDGDAERALFVAPSGSDGSAGTPRDPVRTLARAIEIATATGQDVYVCNGVYTDNVVLDGTAVNLYGGYDCENGWQRGFERAEVAPGSGTALTIRGVVDPVTVDRIDFVAPDATVPSGSSIVAFVSQSTDATLSHVELRAGNAADGAPGADGSSGETLEPWGQDGHAAPERCDADHPCLEVVRGGGWPTVGFQRCSATGTVVFGGRGGDGGNVTIGAVRTLGGPGMPAGSTPGAIGERGTDGRDAERALEGLGTVTRDGYLASNHGLDGSPGQPGQSGGGGDGGGSWYATDASGQYPAGNDKAVVGGGGGQGAAGGCGGHGGKGGGAGGASIALLAEGSTIALRWSVLSSGAGGDGAPGGVGGSGAPAGANGWGAAGSCDGDLEECWVRLRAADGGRGGPGGAGGDGGPGAGGPSIAVVTVGGALERVSTRLFTGAAGRGASNPGGLRAADGESGPARIVSTVSQ